MPKLERINRGLGAVSVVKALDSYLCFIVVAAIRKDRDYCSPLSRGRQGRNSSSQLPCIYSQREETHPCVLVGSQLA